MLRLNWDDDDSDPDEPCPDKVSAWVHVLLCVLFYYICRVKPSEVQDLSREIGRTYGRFSKVHV